MLNESLEPNSDYYQSPEEESALQNKIKHIVSITTIGVIAICVALVIYSIIYNTTILHKKPISDNTTNPGNDTNTDNNSTNDNSSTTENSTNSEFQRPMLFIKDGDELKIMQAIQSDNILNLSFNALIKTSNSILNSKDLTYTIKGNRLLAISREALLRIFYCSAAFRLTNDKRYFDKALRDVNTVCAFKDWHPDHFLDTAEMTAAVSIGYDWLHNNISTTDRESIRQCIIEKGINPGLNKTYNNFIKKTSNWNQVCNSGMTLGAIAIRDTDKNLSDFVINQSVHYIKNSMIEFSPDGNYPEGYSYWGYGATYAGMMFAALDRIFGHTFNLAEWPGYKESGKFIQYMVGISNQCFNFYDSGDKGNHHPILFWFADYFKDQSYIFYDRYYLSTQKNIPNDRFFPITLIYGSRLKKESIAPPTKKMFYGRGKTPVILVRTSWNGSNGVSFGFKGGKATDSHAHMDSGSFVFDALGVRWASDLGKYEYSTIEAAGIDLWNNKQNSERWDLIRLGSKSHNILTLEGEKINVNAYSYFTKVYDTDDNRLGGQLNTTDNYFGRLKSVLREVILINQKYLEITDSIIGGESNENVVWTMTTRAKTELTDSKTVKLAIGKRTCILNVLSPPDVNISFGDNNQTYDFERSNAGTQRVLIKTSIAAGESKNIKVTIVPQ